MHAKQTSQLANAQLLDMEIAVTMQLQAEFECMCPSLVMIVDWVRLARISNWR